jgi:hypothetical protein
MVIPGIPIVGEGVLPKAPPEKEAFACPREIPVLGISTLSSQPNRAIREAEVLLRECWHRHRRGDRSAILELLDFNPFFISVRWVREELVRLLEGGLPLRRQGLPRGRYEMHPLLVVGLVEHLIATGRAANREQAFGKLEELRVLPYGSAKDGYYRGLREKRFRSIVLAFPELAQEISAEESAAQLSRGEVLQAGREITRTWEHPRLGTVKMVLRGR